MGHLYKYQGTDSPFRKLIKQKQHTQKTSIYSAFPESTGLQRVARVDETVFFKEQNSS